MLTQYFHFALHVKDNEEYESAAEKTFPTWGYICKYFKHLKFEYKELYDCILSLY